MNYRNKDMSDNNIQKVSMCMTNYLKEDLCQIWTQEDKRTGEEQLCYWCERAKESKLPAMVKVTNSLLAKRIGILAWYDCKVTNAILEGTDNKVKVIKRKGYGYRDDEYFNLLLLGMHDETVQKEIFHYDMRRMIPVYDTNR